MAKKKSTQKNIVPHKMSPSLFDDQTKSVDGFNLAEFSLSPLTYQSEDLAYQERYFEWDQVLGGVNKKCYFKLTYGATPPNAQTDDYLLVLLYLLHKKGEGTTLSTSFYEIFKHTGNRHAPNKRQIQSIVRHLDALMDMKIETNFIYDRKTKAWNKGVKTRVISSYTYKEKDQKRIRKRENSDGQMINIMEQIKELDEIVFDETFYRHYINDQITFDLKTYFSLENPTPKRLYRFANKYVNEFTSGTFGMDLTHFCITRLGMKQEYVESFKYTSRLVAKLRKPVKRVNETVEEFNTQIEKDKTSPCGYKLKFHRKGDANLALFTQEELSAINSFTSREEKACKDLMKCGVYPNAARRIIVYHRKLMGRRAVSYVEYVIKTFKRKKWNVGEGAKGGVLHKVFKESWYRPAFEEWYSRQSKAEEAEEAKRYGTLDTPTQRVESARSEAQPEQPKVSGNQNRKPLHVLRQPFSLQQFKTEHPELYQQIETVEVARTKAFVEEHGKTVLGNKKEATLAQERVAFYCKQCHDKWAKGESDFRPTILEDLES